MGKGSPPYVRSSELIAVSYSFVDQIHRRFMQKLQEAVSRQRETSPNIDQATLEIEQSILDLLARIISSLASGNFIGSSKLPKVPSDDRETLQKLVEQKLPYFSETGKKQTVSYLTAWLKSSAMSEGKTGLVFAGFGSNEMFPTLISYEIDGMVFGRLKYIETNRCDIDRKGPRAAVIPFAQKEMVERFLYGLDDDIKKNISVFCGRTIPTIGKELISSLEFTEESEREELETKAKEAERQFLDGLASDAFENIRKQSRQEIEDMVEFMPKPEMATMAEALVNLTSIKRRVSRGMETVGGPIDVAVISQSEGLVWVKRKHYFPAELNQRHAERVRSRLARIGENGNATHRRKDRGSVAASDPPEQG